MLASVVAAAALAGCGGSDDEEPAPATSTPAAGSESAPAEGDVVATIEGAEEGEVTGAELEEEVLAAAAAEGRTAPTPGSPEFDLVAGDALDRLLLRRWVAAEAAEQGTAFTEEEAAASAEQLDDATFEELRAKWGALTECDPQFVSRLCGSGGGGEAEPPPDIPPASG